MIQEDARRCLDLDEKIKRLGTKIAQVAQDSRSPRHYARYRGLARCALQNWPARSAPSTALPLRKALPCISAWQRWTTVREMSGHQGPKQVNTRAKAAMMIGVDRHRKHVPESQRYYEKKRQRERNTTKRFGHSVDTCVGSFTGCSPPSGFTRFVRWRWIPQAMGPRDRCL